MKITFLGAAGTVTGSKYLLEANGKKILIDCGLFQGYKELRLRNWDKLPINPVTIDLVILTHAHIDHSGYLPLLVKNGFKGKICCSSATLKLCSILLPDSGYLNEEDAKRCNRYGYSKHHPALPLYTSEDAKQSLEQFQAVEFGKSFAIDEQLIFTLSRSGHLFGSAFITISNGKSVVIFSGDLGRRHDPMLTPPAQLKHTDYLLIESTYGNRLHDKRDPKEMLQEVINSTASAGGHVVIPSFAVGRAQLILYYIYLLKKEKLIPNIPVFLDSPMAISASSLLKEFKNEHKFSPKLCQEICKIARYTSSVEESKKIGEVKVPSIIISASGMAVGGRVLHHLKRLLPDENSTILFTGFQAGGTRGYRLIMGEKSIKIHGEFYPVRAKIFNLHNISSHADYEEILQWLSNFKNVPKMVFITHGEPDSAQSLKEKIEEKFGWNVTVPEYLQSEILS